MSTNKIVKNLKNKDEDFEWYPTTRKMLVKVANLISKIERGYRRNYGYDDFKILDIGAGNGSVFEYIDKIINNPKNEEHKFTFSKFAIEKSTLLIDLMPEDITILGTEFEEQTLIDKPMSVIFSNPPYSNYEDWFYKIAKEGNANDIFLLVPDRWKESKYNFEELIDQRNMTFDILDSFSFMDSDLRKARANVELIHIHPQEEIHQGETYRRKIVEPFDIFFDDTFNFDKFKKFKETKVIDKNENINLVQAGDIVKVLADNYNEDMKNLMDIFHRLSELPPDVISYIADTSINTLKGQLKEKIEGLKQLYWRKLLDQFKPISSRLLAKEKDKIFDKLAKEQYIDFTEKNIYAVVVSILKAVNNGLEAQLISVFRDLTQKKNVEICKSNRHYFDGTFMYNATDWNFAYKLKEEGLKYKLDYRLVVPSSRDYSSDTECGIGGRSLNKIQDIFIIARNLGFEMNCTSRDLGTYERGKAKSFYCKYKDEEIKFGEFKAYQNGNIHMKLNQDFMMRLNVEVGRLLGWVTTPKEAEEEMEIKNAEQYFVDSYRTLSIQQLMIK